jgi:hypothetical protein
MNREQGVFEDNSEISYLIAQKKYLLKYKPVWDDDKIKFVVSGPGLEQAVQNFFANDAIPVQDYLSAFRTIKNIVAAMKDRR